MQRVEPGLRACEHLGLRGGGGNGPTGDVKELRGLSQGGAAPRCRQGSPRGSFGMKSSGGWGIWKPPCAHSSLEVLLLVFRGMPCGERWLPTLGEPRRKKYPCV